MKKTLLSLAILFIFFTDCQSVTLIDDATINDMGAEAFQKIKSETPVEKDPKINSYVQCVARQLLKFTHDTTGVKEWEIVVFKSDQINAFALPGGKIGVYTGIFKVAKTQDQLAAVIGHEIAHVIKRHGKDRVQAQILASGGMEIVEGVVSSNPVLMGALGVGLQYGVILPYSRIQENQADELGLDIMARAGFHPSGAIELWENMNSISGTRTPEILSTHPAPETRIRELKARLPQALIVYETFGVQNRINCQQ